VSTWIDSHCHIQDRYLPSEDDRDAGHPRSASEAIDRASESGVSGIVCVGTDAPTSRQAVELVADLGRRDDGFGCWATAGLHPHDASRGLGEVDAVDRLIGESAEEHPGAVVAVGECGLDYHYDYSPRPAQREVFEAQIALARRRGLALVVHTRQAWDDTVEILRSVGPPERLVVHCFTGGTEEAERCLDLGAHLSFSGIVTFKGAPEVRAAAAMCPADRLLVETDSPFLAPVPHRGKVNQPAWVAVVGRAVAEVRAEDPDELAESSSRAARTVFGLG